MEPLVYAVGIVNAFAWGTKQPAGFTPSEIQFIREILPVYGTVAELKALRRVIGGGSDHSFRAAGSPAGFEGPRRTRWRSRDLPAATPFIPRAIAATVVPRK